MLGIRRGGLGGYFDTELRLAIAVILPYNKLPQNVVALKSLFSSIHL